MVVNIAELAFLIAGAVLGGLAIWLLLRAKLDAAEERGRNESVIELTEFKERHRAVQSELEALKYKFGQEETLAQSLREDLDRISKERAALAERASRVPQLEEQVAERDGRIDEFRREVGLISS